MRITPRHRIRHSADFQMLSKRAQRTRTKFFTIWSHSNDFGHVRLGLAVSRKVGNAVVRNRIRRRIREIVREHPIYSKSVDVVVIPRVDSGGFGFHDLRDDLNQSLTAIGERCP